jgi:hypothetical protein
MRSTADRTAKLVEGMNHQILAMSEIAAQLSAHESELESSVELFSAPSARSYVQERQINLTC